MKSIGASALASALVCAAIWLPAGTASAEPAPKPAPDVIVFTNGDQLSGTLERGVGNSVIFKSDMAGEITVSLDKIKELRSAGSFAVLRKDIQPTRKNVIPGTLLYEGGRMTVLAPLGSPETVPEAQVAYILDQPTYDMELEKKPGTFYGWHGAVSGGTTIVRSTNNGSTYSIGLALNRAIPAVPYLPARNRTAFNLQETYGKLTSPVIPQTNPPTPPSVALTSIFHSDLERDEYFSPRFYGLVQTSFDHNYSQGLNLQQVYGGGIGWTAIKEPRQELDLKVTAQYEKQPAISTWSAPPSRKPSTETCRAASCSLRPSTCCPHGTSSTPTRPTQTLGSFCPCSSGSLSQSPPATTS
jgi:Protein of unknown function, DUF481